MKAEIRPRINLEDRTPLQDVIPLATPFVLFVDPSSACNFQCTFCPTGDRDLIRSCGRYQGVLDFDLYKKIIDELFKGHKNKGFLYKKKEDLDE